MADLERLVREFDDTGVESTFSVGSRTYQVFLYPSPGRDRPRVRWNLYLVDPSGRSPVRGLVFGVAPDVREAIADVERAAAEHAATGEIDPLRSRTRTFRPGPHAR
ncbi:MAG: hypothetical protein D6718_00755 [Acidobacteria bacterium]|nr:MAG: hypothetical protein D6718_00755 [Acidobacteriota bacterium]